MSRRRVRSAVNSVSGCGLRQSMRRPEIRVNQIWNRLETKLTNKMLTCALYKQKPKSKMQCARHLQGQQELYDWMARFEAA